MDQIDKICKFITGKECVESEKDYFYQDENSIYTLKIPKGCKYGDKIAVIHEIGHYIAATPQERNLPNLGLPLDGFIDDNLLMKELMAREFSRLLFYDWGKRNLDDGEFRYFEYLTTQIFESHESKFIPKETDCPWWLGLEEILNEKLSEIGLSISKVKEFIDSLDLCKNHNYSV